MDINFVILLTSVLINFFLIGIIFRHKSSDRDKTMLTTFFASVIGLICWSVANYLADTSTSNANALFWTRATFPPSLFMVWMIWWFSTLFPAQKKFHYVEIYHIYAILAILIIYTSFTSHVVASVSIVPDIGIGEIQLGGAYSITVIVYLLFIGHTIYNFIRSFFRHRATERLQVIYVLIGWSMFLLGAAATNLILPMITGNASWSKFGPIFSVAMVGFTTYAIIKHHLMDIRIILQRSIIYTTIATIIVSVYLLLVYTLGFALGQFVEMREIVSVIITTLFGIFTTPLIDRGLRHITNPWFFKNTFSFLDATKKIHEIIQSHVRIRDIVSHTITTTKDVLQLDKMAIVSLQQETYDDGSTTSHIENLFTYRQLYSLRNHNALIQMDKPSIKSNLIPWMRKNEYYIYLPIVFNSDTIGAIFIGQKKSGDAFYQKDYQLLEHLTNHLSAGIEKAHLFEVEKDQSRQLEEQIKKRTREIHTLQKSQEKMMIDISHTLKSPLTILRAQLDELTRTAPQTDVSSLQYSIDDVSKSITSLLKLTRMENANQLQSSSHALIDLSAILELLCDHFKGLASQSGISLKHSIHSDCFVAGNHEEIEDLIVNLIENAIKYMPADTPEKEIVVILAHSKDHIVLTINDTGSGIDKKDLPHIFDRFYRSDSRRNKDVKGTGLGLAICKEIIKNHGGTISAENLTEGGLSFTVNFPAPSPYIDTTHN